MALNVSEQHHSTKGIFWSLEVLKKCFFKFVIDSFLSILINSQTTIVLFSSELYFKPKS